MVLVVHVVGGYVLTGLLSKIAIAVVEVRADGICLEIVLGLVRLVVRPVRAMEIRLGIVFGLVAIEVLKVHLVVLPVRAMEIRLGIVLGLVAIEVLRVRLVALRGRVIEQSLGGLVNCPDWSRWRRLRPRRRRTVELVVLVIKSRAVHCLRESPEASRKGQARLQVLDLLLHDLGNILIHPCRHGTRCLGATSGRSVGLREDRSSRVVVVSLGKWSFLVLEVAVDGILVLRLVVPDVFGGACRGRSSPCITVQLADDPVSDKGGGGILASSSHRSKRLPWYE